MYGYIYKTTNLITKKFYIGKRVSSKFLGNKYLGSGVRLQSSIQHHGAEHFDVIQIDSAENDEELNQKEKFWISFLHAQDLDIAYNIADGGQGCSGFDVWNKGKTIETCPSLKQSQETKDKRSESLKKAYKEGRHKTCLSDEARKVMSEKAKARPHPPTTLGRVCYTDGINNKMLNPDQIAVYEDLGWVKGKTKISDKPAWNKGLSKDTDARVAKYAQHRKDLFAQGVQIGYCNCNGNQFCKGQKVSEYQNNKL